MRPHITFAVVVGLLLGTILVASADNNEKAPLDVRIAKVRGLIGVGSDSPRAELHVVVTNTSKDTTRIWDQWNSWGYHNLTLSLEFKDGDEQNVKLERFGGNEWGQNAPDPVELAPGECYVFSVWLAPEMATTPGSHSKLIMRSQTPISQEPKAFGSVARLLNQYCFDCKGRAIQVVSIGGNPVRRGSIVFTLCLAIALCTAD